MKAAQRGDSVPPLKADGGHAGNAEIYPKDGDEITREQHKQPPGKLEDVVDELEQNLNALFESVKANAAKQPYTEISKESPGDSMIHSEEVCQSLISPEPGLVIRPPAPAATSTSWPDYMLQSTANDEPLVQALGSKSQLLGGQLWLRKPSSRRRE